MKEVAISVTYLFFFWSFVYMSGIRAPATRDSSRAVLIGDDVDYIGIVEVPGIDGIGSVCQVRTDFRQFGSILGGVSVDE